MLLGIFIKAESLKTKLVASHFCIYCSLTSLFTSSWNAHLYVYYTVRRGTRNAGLILAQPTMDDISTSTMDIRMGLSTVCINCITLLKFCSVLPKLVAWLHWVQGPWMRSAYHGVLLLAIALTSPTNNFWHQSRIPANELTVMLIALENAACRKEPMLLKRLLTPWRHYPVKSSLL